MGTELSIAFGCPLLAVSVPPATRYWASSTQSGPLDAVTLPPAFARISACCAWANEGAAHVSRAAATMDTRKGRRSVWARDKLDVIVVSSLFEEMYIGPAGAHWRSLMASIPKVVATLRYDAGTAARIAPVIPPLFDHDVRHAPVMNVTLPLVPACSAAGNYCGEKGQPLKKAPTALGRSRLRSDRSCTATGARVR